MAGSVNKVILIGNLGADRKFAIPRTGGPSAICGLRPPTLGGTSSPAKGARKESGIALCFR